MEYGDCAASLCYPFKLRFYCLVIQCWSSFGLDLLRALATKKDFAELSSPVEGRYASIIYSSTFLRSKFLIWLGLDRC